MHGPLGGYCRHQAIDAPDWRPPTWPHTRRLESKLDRGGSDAGLASASFTFGHVVSILPSTLAVKPEWRPAPTEFKVARTHSLDEQSRCGQRCISTAAGWNLRARW